MTIIPFVLVSILVITFALLLVTMRNAVHGALALVVVLIGLAIHYLMLSAEFIFVVQLAVYAGAIMVLFLFVMMLLNIQGTEEFVSARRMPQIVISLILGVVLLVEVAIFGAHAARLTEHPLAAVPADFGSPAQVGHVMMTKFLIPFEIIAVILLVSMVGAVVMAKRKLL